MGKKRVHEGGPSLTEDDIELMAKGWNMTIEDTKKEMVRMLQKHPSSTSK